MSPEEIGAILARYPTALRPLSPPEALGNAGGLSGARLWRLRTDRGPVVLRAWPTDGPSPRALRQVHDWLAEASPLGFVPVPLAGLDGRTFLEHGRRLWELAPWMPGVADPGRPPSRSRIEAGFGGLAAFHQRLAHRGSRGPSPGLARRLLELDDLRRGGFDLLAAAIARRPADPIAPEARRWIDLARRRAPAVADRLRRESGQVVTLQPCLRDARPDHLLFEGDRLTGLVDFGAMGVDTVAGDLARLASEWLGRDRPARSEALAAYESVRPLDAAETALIDAFEISTALLGPGHWVRWHFAEGRTFDDPAAVARGLRRGLEHLEGG